ncbi:MAG: immune inhibitor A [Candidatus Bathyarchaeia archaeon]
MKKIVSLLLVTIFLMSIVIAPSSASSTKPRPILSTDGDLKGIDGTPNLRSIVLEGAKPDDGNPWTVPVSDDYLGGFYNLDFVRVAEGVHCNIWIGLSTDVWPGGYQDYYDPKGPGFADDEWHFMYPWTQTGWRFWPGYHDVIYGENITYLVNEFDNNIWETVTTFFGMYADRPGPLNDYKIQILIFNIRDGLFYDPENAPWFIEGYFWDYVSNLNNANIIHIDTYQWYRRLGPNPQPDPAGDPPRPYEYESTFAHEFQHLIHSDIDHDETLWVDEGCADLAGYVCGYGFPASHISEYLIYWWATSLVIWQNQLSNYGATFLWTFYVYEHYGSQRIIWDIVHEQANGIEGYNNVFKAHKIRKNFDQVFQEWAVANYLDDLRSPKGIYGYYALDIPSEDTEWWDLPYSLWIWEYLYPDFFDTQVTAYPTVGYNYPFGSSLPYVVNYVEFYNVLPNPYGYLEIYFDGDDYAGVLAYSGTYEWYSDGIAYSWFRLGQAFSIPVTGATLNFWNNYDIEEDWDYGYVEVHDLDTDEWYTLQGLTTISTIPNPQDNPNCPDEFEPTTYLAAVRWNAFTGSSGGWYQETMDLTLFAGHDIELYFTYWTDPYTLGRGWYIDDIEIPEIGFFDDIEDGPDGWDVNEGWYITTGAVLNCFQVNFIKEFELPMGRRNLVYHMKLDDETEEGLIQMMMFNMRNAITTVVMVAANQPGYEHSFEATYVFAAELHAY